MATSKPASAAASVRALPILREPPVIRAAPREVAAKAVLVETAEFVIVQPADDDEEGENGQDRGHGKLRVRHPGFRGRGGGSQGPRAGRPPEQLTPWPIRRFADGGT